MEDFRVWYNKNKDDHYEEIKELLNEDEDSLEVNLLGKRKYKKKWSEEDYKKF